MNSHRHSICPTLVLLLLCGLLSEQSPAQSRESAHRDKGTITTSETPEISGGGMMNMMRSQAAPGDLKSVPSFPFLPPLAPAAPTLTSSFETVDFVTDGSNNGGYLHIPPDPIGAAGPTRVVCVVNCSIEWYTKTGTRLSTQSLASFFAILSPLTQAFDPKVIYDQYEGRFIVVALEQTDVANGDAANTSRIFLAVSATSDPAGAWYFAQINSKVNIGGVDRWADYPGFAVDDKAVYVTANMFGFGAGGTFGGVRLWIINKGVSGGFYSGAAASASLSDPYAGGGIATTTQPAHMFGTPPGTMGTFLVSYSGLNDGTNEYLQIVRVNDPLGTPTFTQTYLSCGNLEANPMPSLPKAPQLGVATLIETNDRRALEAVWRGNQLYVSATILPASGTDAGQATAHWFNVNTTTLSALTLTDQGNIGGEDIATGTYTFFPSIAVDASGNLVIGFAASASTIYAGAYFTGRAPADAAGTTRGSGVLRAGTDYYVRTFGSGRNRWGDYTGTSIDPSDGSFWLFNQFAMTRGTPTSGGEDGRWRTAFGNLLSSGLPIQVASFAGSATEDGHAFLEWETISEIDNMGFVVQKSREPAGDYLTVPNSFIPGHGTTNVRQRYSYTDRTASPGTWYYRLQQTDLDGSEHFHPSLRIEIPATAQATPKEFSLSQNFPNPFNPVTVVEYTVGGVGSQGPGSSNDVRLVVYDLLGREVAVLVDEKKSPGRYQVDIDGSGLASGIYVYRLQVGSNTAMRKMTLLK